MTHTLVRDVESAIDRAESNLYDVKNESVESINYNIDQTESAIDDIRSELRYVNDEMEELQEYADACEEITDRFGGIDPDDWDIPEPDEIEELRLRVKDIDILQRRVHQLEELLEHIGIEVAAVM